LAPKCVFIAAKGWQITAVNGPTNLCVPTCVVSSNQFNPHGAVIWQGQDQYAGIARRIPNASFVEQISGELF
jgi:hypothetical protein